MEEKNYFKCRNFRLNCFIRAFGERCIDSTINEKNNKRIWLFERSERLDKILTLWDRVKDEIDTCSDLESGDVKNSSANAVTKDLFLEVLMKYRDSEHGLINEFSVDFVKDRKKLEEEIDVYKKLAGIV